MDAHLNIIGLVPFSVHVLAGTAALMNWNIVETQVDTWEYWLKTVTNTISIFPSQDYTVQYYSAITQITCALVSAVFHFLGPIKLRRLSYGILLTMCAVTTARHFMISDGQSLFGCFYINIAFYVMLVFYQQQKEGVPQLTKSKLTE